MTPNLAKIFLSLIIEINTIVTIMVTNPEFLRAIICGMVDK